MEPLCCLFGIFDANLAYLYWLLHGQEFCYETFEKEFLKEKLQKSLRTLTFEEQYDDTLDMIEHLESWKNLYSQDLPTIMESLDQKFKPVVESEIWFSNLSNF